jgi:hypothetical protein
MDRSEQKKKVCLHNVQHNSLRNQVISNLQAYHKEEYLPYSFYKDFSIERLLSWCHPTDRKKFQEHLKYLKQKYDGTIPKAQTTNVC